MARRRHQDVRSDLHGMILIDKPKGMISKDVSRWFEKKLGRLKLGHVGTLDPMAEGVLPLLFGKATRLQDYLLEMPKAYRFRVHFGVMTTTGDATGEVVSEQKSPGPFSEEQLAAACSSLLGKQVMVPPIYSAIKYQGKPLYEYAREGREAEVPLEDLSRHVSISELKFIDQDDSSALFEVHCSKGTYVRSVACKIAEFLNTCGMVTELIRIQAAGQPQESCLSLEEIEKDLPDLKQSLIPMNEISLDLPRWEVSDIDVKKRLRMGQKMYVDMRYFEDGFRSQSIYSLNSSHIETLLLADDSGRSFGIGSASLHQAGRIEVVMRRGL